MFPRQCFLDFSARLLRLAQMRVRRCEEGMNEELVAGLLIRTDGFRRLLFAFRPAVNADLGQI